MHTLRYLIGDPVFFDSVTTLLYGTATPQPGEFTTVYRNTEDFIQLVNALSGDDLSWFFDVYLYQAKLPELQEQRSNGELTLSWLVPDDLPFPMPVEVSVNGNITTLQLPDQNTLKVTAQDVVIVDPNSKLLRFEARYDATAK